MGLPQSTTPTEKAPTSTDLLKAKLVEAPVPNSYTKSSLKRIADLLVSALGLLVFAFVLLPVSIAIFLTSPGAIFFRQTRLGRDGQPFTLLKFRTMREPRDGEDWNKRTERNDTRLIPVGTMLRRTYVDELPQFLNVLMGQMSIVGPRPEIPGLAAKIASQHPRFEHRLIVKPGITGPAQLFYKHAENETDAWRRYYYDAYYVRKSSFSLDIWIMARTILRMIRYRGQ